MQHITENNTSKLTYNLCTQFSKAVAFPESA